MVKLLYMKIIYYSSNSYTSCLGSRSGTVKLTSRTSSRDSLKDLGYRTAGAREKGMLGMGQHAMLWEG